MKIPDIFLKYIEKGINFYSRHSIFPQLSKFLLVGILNTVVGYLIFFVLVGFMNYMLATVAGHLLAVAHSYIWNRYWVFSSKNHPLTEFIKFNFVYLFVLVENLILMPIFVAGLGFDPRIAALMCIPITTFISFFGHRYLSFKKWKPE
jgi:putative flippase GtrA